MFTTVLLWPGQRCQCLQLLILCQINCWCNIVYTLYPEDSFVLSSLSPNLPISPVICPFLLSSVVYRLTLIPLFAGRLWTLFLDFLLIGKASAEARVCIFGYWPTHRWIDSGYHPLPKTYVIILSYVISIWSFSWSFGVSRHYYYQKQPDLTISKHRLISVFLT